MKKTIIAFCIALLAMAPLGLAVDQEKGITPNGVSQGTVVNIFKTHETLLNELAADHDADNATVAELVTDHDADNDIIDLATNAGIIQPNGVLLGAPVLGDGSTAGKAKTQGGGFSYTVDGVYYYKAATDDVCNATGLVDLTTDYTKVLFSIGAAGTCTVTDGTHGASLGEAIWAAVPADEIVIGGLTIGDGGAHDWDVAVLSADGGTYVAPNAITDAVMGSVAADLTATTVSADLSADTVVGSGTSADPSVSLTD